MLSIKEVLHGLTICISQLHSGLEDGNHHHSQHHHDIIHLRNVHRPQNLQYNISLYNDDHKHSSVAQPADMTTNNRSIDL